MRLLPLAFASLTALVGCGTRSVLRLPPPPPSYAWQVDGREAAVSVSGSDAGSDPVVGSAPVSSSGPGSGSGTVSGSGSVSGKASTSGVVWSRLPAPHLAPRTKEPVPAPRTVEQARALVGRRDPRSHTSFALAVAAALTGRTAPDLADGEQLVAWARTRDALATITPGAAEPPSLAPGDVLVFDRAAGGKPASLIAVVLARDPRGVVELLYVAGGVIRIGFVDPTRPRTARDRDRRIVNTYLRHTADQPPAGTRFLAGELVSARLRLP